MPNLAAVKTAFIYGGLPIDEKDNAAENYASTKSPRILILSFSAPRLRAFQLDALRARPACPPILLCLPWIRRSFFLGCFRELDHQSGSETRSVENSTNIH